MKQRPTRWILAGALALVAAAVQAEVADIQWAADGGSAREFQVAPGKFAEWCGKLKRGDKLQWKFEASAPLNYNIHYHEGKEVHFPAKQDGVAQAEGALDVTLDQDYCWMWTNKTSSPASIKASLKKQR